MTPRISELCALLQEANFDPWESVSSVLHLTGPRAERLKAHILETKQNDWKLIGSVVQVPLPPADLASMLEYELQVLRNLEDSSLDLPLQYCDREMTVAGMIRLSARHSVWHAGQMALKHLD
ncbi:hypothetical protein [Deinococcus cellulosilyticus]|uniref:DinB-like domain-containing protein n=1 Tax=Deinococcus cellulosilyticus (strain DSM 18568 / NBRC 106333 / KACC 11606 / 5516J-15) TaxID=1223518 RepID=A0A511MXW5_DEIC1|nr:hypothetical protein [Deinococcus cellulosilyticus]GEM45403.1 hypothetical protein DC3_10380 [Deinococcus cellulosilyticus NBRC 106333 = KACC 11606]